MNDDRPAVKGPGPAPQARTRLARRAVVTAARELFVADGYATTTVEAVSRAADVPVATVYRLFSSKRGILQALLDTAIAGDDEPVTMRERTAGLRADPDPAEVFADLAATVRAINERTNDVYRVLTSAAASDPTTADLLATVDKQRDAGQGGVVRALARRGAVRDGMSAREATDIAHAMLAPQMYTLLVVDRGWTPQRYERWLAGTLVAQLT